MDGPEHFGRLIGPNETKQKDKTGRAHISGPSLFGPSYSWPVLISAGPCIA